MRSLLDVNVLIALLDAAHEHHRNARRWMEANIEQGWASCPITQNGCLRIMSQPSYPGFQPLAVLQERLREATETSRHVFWPDAVSVLSPDLLDWGHVLGSRQLTDAYLLALAIHHGGKFVTMDRSIAPHAVKDARDEHLVQIVS
jgi:hypothetical protein